MGKLGSPVEMFVQVVPPSVVLKTLSPSLYPEKVTQTLSGSVLETARFVGEALPTGKVPAISVQEVPASVDFEIASYFMA